MAGDLIPAHHGALVGGGAAWTPPITLAAWWYGDSVADRSGGGHTLSLYGNATMGANGLALDGTGDYASPGAFSDLNATTTSTWAFWFKLAASVNYNPIFRHNGQFVYRRNFSSTSWQLYMWANTRVPDAANVGPAAENVWHHVVFARNSTQMKVYVDNGSPTILTAASGGLAVPSENLFLGYSPAEGAYTNGWIDDVMLSTDEASAEQVADIYSNSPGSHAP